MAARMGFYVLGRRQTFDWCPRWVCEPRQRDNAAKWNCGIIFKFVASYCGSETLCSTVPRISQAQPASNFVAKPLTLFCVVNLQKMNVQIEPKGERVPDDSGFMCCASKTPALCKKNVGKVNPSTKKTGAEKISSDTNVRKNRSRSDNQFFSFRFHRLTPQAALFSHDCL